MNQKEIEKAVSTIIESEIFSVLPKEEAFEIIKNYGEIVSFSKNETIFSHEDYRQAIGIVLKGSAQVFKGRMPLSIHRVGNIFGCVTLFSSEKYYATEIIACSDCKVLFISKDGITLLLRTNPNFAEKYISYLTDRIYFLNRRIDSLTAGSTEERLLNYIKSNCDYSDGERILKIRSYGALAASLDAGRASLYRAMDSLTEKGIIIRKDKIIYLLKE